MSATLEILTRGAVGIPTVLPPLFPKGTFGESFGPVCNPLPRSWNREFYVAFTAQDAFWETSFWMILVTLADMGWKGVQDGVRGEFLRWNTLP